MRKYDLSPTSQDTVHEYVLKAVKLTQTMLTLLPPTVVVIPQSYDDLLQDTNRATWNEKKVGPHVKITHYRPVLLYGNHAHVAVKGLVGNVKLGNKEASCNTSLPTTSAAGSKVEDAKPQTKSDILVTSNKPPSPINVLPVTTQTSIRQSKEETPHCSTYSADFHGKQTPTHYATSRTSPTNRDLVNKTYSPLISSVVPLAASQSLTLPCPPISNNMTPSITSQPSYQVTNVILSNKSQQVHASHPLTTNSPISSLQVSQNDDSVLQHTSIAYIPLPPSKRPDVVDSVRGKRYRPSLSQSPPSPHKTSPVTKKVLSPTQADSIIPSTPVIKESPPPKMPALYKEIRSNPQAQKHTNSKSISPEVKPFLTTDASRKATNTSSSINHATQSISPKNVTSTSRSQNKKTKISVRPAVFQEILPSIPHVNLHSSTRQNQKTSPTRQRQSQSQRQRVNQQQSVVNNPSQRHPMILRSKKIMPASSPNSKGRIILIA